MSKEFKDGAKAIATVFGTVGFFAALFVADMEKVREDDLKTALAAGRNSITLPGGDSYRIVCTEPGMANAQRLKIADGKAIILTDEKFTWEPVRAKICDTMNGPALRS